MIKKSLLAIVFILCVQTYSFADGVRGGSPVDDSLLFLSYLGIAVATISGISYEKRGEASSAMPIGRLKIDETIRGDVPQRVRFEPIFYRMKDSKNTSSGAIRQWKGSALADLVGKKFIVVTSGSNLIAIYPYSKKTKNYIITHMPSKGLDNGILIALFVILIGISFLPRRYTGRLNSNAPWMLLAIQIIIYAIYEWGTPAYYNIRVDLLLAIPAIATNAVLTAKYYSNMKNQTS